MQRSRFRTAYVHIKARQYRGAVKPINMMAHAVLIEDSIIPVTTNTDAAVVRWIFGPATVGAAPRPTHHTDADVDTLAIALLSAVRAFLTISLHARSSGARPR